MKINYIKTKITLLFVIAIMMFGVPGFTGVSHTSGIDTSTLSVPQSVVEGVASQKVNTYIVMMYDLPVVAYEGDIKGFKATKTFTGKINPNSANVEKYVDYLSAKHDSLLQSVGLENSAKIYDYVYAANGFAAEMTEFQALQLKSRSDVYNVFPNEIVFPQTDSSGEFLGLTDPAGPYSKGYTGEGVVIGVIDTGIWPEHASFADDGSYGPAAGFTGIGCEFVDFECNNKLLSAKAYRAGFSSLHPNEYDSARDSDGHGSHTAGTAAGNAGVEASVLGSDFGEITGIAPRAQLSVYKVCWNDAGCATVDLEAAIDQAVADGVDVINYSIGSTSFAVGPDDVAFLFAQNAGVMVATSNGNSGPGAATTGSPASVPWVTSVGANTQTRNFLGTVTLGDGTTYTGVTLTSGTGELDLVDAADHGNELCDPAVAFSPSIEGDIVLCRRGAFARVAKSLSVSLGGGAGMILYNAGLDSQVTDNHYVPSLHVDHVDGPAIKTYIAASSGVGVASLSGGQAVDDQGSVMAAFSSRGPNSLSSDIIKPDVTAPGVNILAANSLTPYLGSQGESFQSISGTSMSSPHVAGLFALIASAHRGWSPSMAKSALMTTSRQDVTKEDGTTQADPFDMGAGHVAPGGASILGSVFEPGLVYDVDRSGTGGFWDYAGYTCGADLGIFSSGSCSFLGSRVPTDPSDLNLASIGVGELVGSQTVQRTVTSVAKEIGWRTYTVNVNAPEGFDISVSPSSFTLKSGMSVSFEVTISNDGSADLGAWSFGSLTWEDMTGLYSVYSPIAVRAFAFDAPTDLHLSGTEGSADFDVKFGYSGDYSATASGLNAATVQSGNVVDDPANDINVALGTGVGITVHQVEVPVGAVYISFNLYDDFVSGTPDLDLYVFSPSGYFGGSGSGTSEEQVSGAFPEPGTYDVIVHGWRTDGPDTDYDIFSFVVESGPSSNLSLSGYPSMATVGQTSTLTVSWTGLSSETKYLGAVVHYDDFGVLAITVIAVDA